jgi:DNA-binding NtrC family response regulator
MIRYLSVEAPTERLSLVLPQKGPVLILGRPELFLPYMRGPRLEPGDGPLHRLLWAAGYPGRYEFMGARPGEPGFRTFRDRQTGLRYRPWRSPQPEGEAAYRVFYDPLEALDAPLGKEEPEARSEEYPVPERVLRGSLRWAVDYGLIFHATVDLPVQRSVTILAGTSPLGTWAAAQALTDPEVGRPWKERNLEPALDPERSEREGTALQPVEILVRVAVPFPPGEPLPELHFVDLSILTISSGWRGEGAEVAALLRMFQGEVPSDEAGERFRALYEVTPHPEEEKYVIHVQPCTYPLEGPMWAEGRPVALVGGPEMGDLLHQIQHLAEDDEPVLLTGPSGTGKELVARLIYGYRCQWLLEQGRLPEEELAGQSPFLPVNCGAIPGNLVEVELFGQVKGAFTDAAERLGLLRAAGEGVACLDEIGELDYALQSKLLRVLQERKVRPVGADREVEYAAKVVAMTNRDLLAEIRERKFRADLHARFPHRLELPPLRDRRQDVPALILAYLHGRNPALRAVAVSEHALRVLLTEEYAESNVRTLQDGFLYALLVAHHGQVDRIALSDLPPAWRERVGLTMALEEDTWYEFRWAEVPDVAPLAAARSLKEQIERCRPEELTTAHVLTLMEQTQFSPVLKTMISDQQVKEAVSSIKPLARLCSKRRRMKAEERRELVARLRADFGLSYEDLSKLFGVDRSAVSRW